jgi:hypothetical protein
MTTKPHTHRAYCVLRHNYRSAGEWVETGFARTADDGIGLKVQLTMLPVSGFDGHILLRPIEAETPLPLAPEPEEDEDGED